jgi:hypothetical protein
MFALILTSLMSLTASALYPPNYPGFKDLPTVTDDADLVRAVTDQKRLSYIQAAGLTVDTLMPDDTQGAKHQKFFVKTSRGQRVLLVYQLDCGHERVPVKVGDKVGVGGEFIYDRGALVHWLHSSSRKTRPDGYIEHNHLRYGLDAGVCR